jgi:hypothetical protein
MTVYSALASVVLGLHLLFILWVVFGVLLTRRRPFLRWLHFVSLSWGVLVDILSWTCPLTRLENWLRSRAGLSPYQGGVLLHYLDALVYPDVRPELLTVGAVAVCFFNVVIYARRFRRRGSAAW